jgi:hypothetical protein
MKTNCKNCLRRTKTDKDYMDNLDCYGRKIDFNCLVRDEELGDDIYKNIVCKEFVKNDEK